MASKRTSERRLMISPASTDRPSSPLSPLGPAVGTAVRARGELAHLGPLVFQRKIGYAIGRSILCRFRKQAFNPLRGRMEFFSMATPEFDILMVTSAVADF